jgi:protein SCO1
MKKIRFALISLVSLIILVACSTKTQSGKQISSFTFKDQQNRPFGTDELTGKVWIADFIFTECETVCLPMSLEMAALQKKFKEQNIEVEFVSFTVDPEVDTAEVLRKYVRQFTDDESNWHLLSDYSQKKIETFAREQFQTIIQKPKSSTQVIHGTNFYLIDDQGMLVKEYNYVDRSYMDEIVNDIQKIRNY